MDTPDIKIDWPDYFDAGEKSTATQIYSKLTKICSLNLDISPNKRGIDVREEASSLLKIYALYKKMLQTPARAWAPVEYGNINSGLDQFPSVLKKFQEFSKSSNGDEEFERRRLRGNANSFYLDHKHELEKFVALSAALDVPNVDLIVENVSQKFHDKEQRLIKVEQGAKSVESRLNSILSEAEGILKSIQKVSGDSAISAQSAHFQTATIVSGVIAILWFLGAAAVIVYSINVSFELLDVLSTHTVIVDGKQVKMETADYVAVAAPRLIIFALLYFCIIWFARNFSASIHNMVVNRHRVNALKTFRAFADGTDDKNVKNQILLQATYAVFSHQVSGFLKDESSSVENNKLVNIVKGVSNEE